MSQSRPIQSQCGCSKSFDDRQSAISYLENLDQTESCEVDKGINRMNFQRLRYFQAVASLGNFGRAAQVLNISQPALSRQIQILEAEVGSMLFSRENKLIELTPNGQLLKARSVAILEDVKQLKVDMALRDRLSSEHFVIATIQSMVDGWLIDDVAETLSEFPGSRVDLRELPSGEIIDRVRRNYVDIGVVGASPIGSDITIAASFKEDYLAVMHFRHRLASQGPISLVELSKECFVHFHRGYRIRDTFDAVFNEAGLRLAVSCEVDSVGAIQTFVATGNYITLLPRFTAERMQKAGGLIVAQAVDLELSRYIHVISNSNRRPKKITRRFLERIRRYHEPTLMNEPV
jgi:DNA-binding transcriptional LysR family regulator